MFDKIIKFLSYVWIFLLSAGAICGVIVFFLAATWMQVQERSASHGKA